MNGVPRREWLPLALPVPVALAAAFFVAFNSVFSDAFGTSAYVGLMLYVTAAYGVLGMVLGAIWPARGWHWAFWLAWPAAVLLVAYSFVEPGRIGWHLVVIVLALVGGAIGGLAGSGFRLGRSSRERVAA